MAAQKQIEVLIELVESAAQALHRVIAVQDVDAETAKSLTEIARQLHDAPAYAADYGRRFEDMLRSVPASERDLPHELRSL